MGSFSLQLVWKHLLYQYSTITIVFYYLPIYFRQLCLKSHSIYSHTLFLETCCMTKSGVNYTCHFHHALNFFFTDLLKLNYNVLNLVLHIVFAYVLFSISMLCYTFIATVESELYFMIVLDIKNFCIIFVYNYVPLVSQKVS